MVCRVFFFFLPVIVLFPTFLQQHPHVKGDAILIHKACQNTGYYDLCVSSLRSDPNSTAADTKGLARIMIGVAAANATSTSLFLSSMVIGTVNDPVTAKLLRGCADKYSLADDALQAAARDLTTESYDYAYVHITAARDYPNVCRNSFKRNAGSTYPPELARREDGLQHLCDVISGIVGFLGF
ncbi:hypothetical protein MLD38_012217 [Melastoma candidum]|uniref:Uncharacterized protein n=1 Tax=Melastoma candidum TaxID=119954 RepID=A0ACB9R6Q6_9MYRT|nr:hypothetical protein MLD38_012217 [Melastoma candidum]